jgi:hypothetical protein
MLDLKMDGQYRNLDPDIGRRHHIHRPLAYGLGPSIAMMALAH